MVKIIYVKGKRLIPYTGETLSFYERKSVICQRVKFQYILLRMSRSTLVLRTFNLIAEIRTRGNHNFIIH